MNRESLIRLYFPVAALGGLLLIVIGAVLLIQLAVSDFILKTPPYPSASAPPEVKSYVGELRDKADLTEEQKAALAEWQQDYDRWRQERRNFNYREARQKENISISLAMLIVGLPIFLYHVRYVRKAG